MNVIDQYLTERATSVRTVESRRAYRTTLRLAEQHTGKPLVRLTEADLIGFIAHGDPAPATAARRRTVLKSFYKWATRAGVVKTNPANDIDAAVTIKVKNVRTRHWLTPAQALALLDTPTGPFAERDRALLATLVYTGLRVTEVANLTWDDIDLVNQRITVIGKGEKPAVVGDTADLAAVLAAWKEHGHRHVFPRGRSVVDFGTQGFSLVYEDTPLGDEGIRLVVGRAGAAIGVPGLRPLFPSRSSPAGPPRGW